MARNFEWHPDEPPPPIESHSRAKLKVLRSYLRAYFDRLNVNLAREKFMLDLVDGFAGGGTFLENGSVLSGTPLIMLEEAIAASERLNRNRIKPLKIDCKFYFVDKEKAHTDHLHKVLSDNGHEVDGKRIIVRTGPFKNENETIIKAIQQRQPRAGRAIFSSRSNRILSSRISTHSPHFSRIAIRRSYSNICSRCACKLFG